MIEDHSILEELGLSKNESKVYRSLVEFGKLSAGETSAKSGVSYSKIYNVLDSLISKGLVLVIPEKTKKFGPNNPDSLSKLIDEKEKKLNAAKEKIKELKKFYEVKEKNPVILAMGDKGFYKILDEMKETEKYALNVKWTTTPRPEWLRRRKEKIRKGIIQKDLVRYNEETKKNVQEWLKITKDIRKIENEGIAMSILDDREVMIALIKSDVTLLIRDKPFTKLMKRMFLDTYNAADSIK